MADNPFDPKYRGLLGEIGVQPRGLLDYIGRPTPSVDPAARGLADLLMESPMPPAPTNPFSGFGSALESMTFGNSPAALFAPAPPLFSSTPPPPLGFSDSSANIIGTPLPPTARYVPPPIPVPVATQTKRKGFFSFHYADIIRVNNVRLPGR